MTKGFTTQTQEGLPIQALFHDRRHDYSPMQSFRSFIQPRDIFIYEEVNLGSSVSSDSTIAKRTSPSLTIEHANPLTPLRQRDARALDELFESDHIQEITLDIYRYLARMYPEPCWEDEPYEFLHGYI